MKPSLPWMALWLSISNNHHYLVSATFTIGAVDTETGQVGAAGCTCLLGSDGEDGLYGIGYRAAPGKGVLLFQALPPLNNLAVYDTGVDLLKQGEAPAVIIETITDPSLDTGSVAAFDGTEYPYNEVRQYGCVDLEGRAEGYTGASIQPYYFGNGDTFENHQTYTQEHITGEDPFSRFTYSAQGNIVSLNTVPTLAETFTAAGCDLADRLFLALTAVDDANTAAKVNANEDMDFEGDVRCEAVNGAPGHQAYLHVDNADGTPLIHIEWVAEVNIPASVFTNFTVPNGTDVGEYLSEIMAPFEGNKTLNPYDDLRAQYAKWRKANPCPSLPDTDTMPEDTSSTAAFVPSLVWMFALSWFAMKFL